MRRTIHEYNLLLVVINYLILTLNMLFRWLLLVFVTIVNCNLKQYVRNYAIKNEKARAAKIAKEAIALPPKLKTKNTDSSGALHAVIQVVKGIVKVGGTAVIIGATATGAVLAGRKAHEMWKARQAPTDDATASSNDNNDSKNSGSNKKKVSISSVMSIAELLSSTRAMNNEGSIEDPITPGRPCVLLFDCDEKLVAAADITARMEYFNLMANISSNGQDFAVVYIPSSTNSNPHIMERNATFRPDWKFLSNSHDGRKYSASLREKYDIKPEELRIMLLGNELNIITENALDLLRISPYGMPWTPTPLKQLIGTEFLSPDLPSTEPITSELNDIVIGLYFSASWCKPCQTFTPKLVNMYNNITEKSAEIIFVSLDQEEEAFEEYRKKMKWNAIPFRDARRALLQIGLQVKSIPALVFIDEQGKLVTSSGVTEVMNDPQLERFPYREGAVDLSSGLNVEKLQRSVTMVAFTDGCHDDIKKMTNDIMNNIHDKNNVPIEIPRSPRSDLLYSTLQSTSKLNDALRMLTNLPPADENIIHFVILDLAKEEYYKVGLTVINGDERTEAKISTLADDLIKAYQSFDVKMMPMAKLPPAAPSAEGIEEELVIPDEPLS